MSEVGYRIFHVSEAGKKLWLMNGRLPDGSFPVAMREVAAGVFTYAATMKIVKELKQAGINPFIRTPVGMKPNQSLRARNVAQRLRDE